MTEAAPGASAPGRPGRILIVDDDPGILDVLSGVLELDGHEVDAATDAGQALARLQDRAYDAIISDVQMPGKTGIDLYREVEAREPRLRRRFILLTGSALTDGTRAFVAATGTPILSKPFDFDEIRRTLQRVLAP
jgi:CheY-like chemotaxis protein